MPVMENERVFPDKVAPVKEHEPPLHEYFPDANVWPATVIVQVPPVGAEVVVVVVVGVVVAVVVVGAAAVVLMVPWTPPIVALNDVEVLVVGAPLSE